MIDRRQEIIDRVEFRWRQHEEEFVRRLAQAAREAGRSQSDHARELLKNALTASDDLQQAVEALHQDVLEIRQQLRHMPTMKEGVRAVHDQFFSFRNEVASCVYKLLIEVGGVSPDAAKQWVQETFQNK